MTEQESTNPNNMQMSPDGDTTFITSTAGARHTYLPGDIIDGAYQLTSAIGSGGMGAVFACRHMVMHTEYAIKILSGEQLQQESWARFQAEAQALAKLNHPNIVSIFNMGIDAGRFPYFVMDLLRGETLDRLVDAQKIPPVPTILDIFIQLADALASAHSRGVVHRDIKPSNVMLLPGKNGPIVKIVDFGIARLSQQDFASQSQTKTGMIFGTPFYMSPEQCQGKRVDERSDIYSLGCTLYECLTGAPPFCGENSFHTFMLHQHEPLPPLASRSRGAHFPDGLENALAKMLAKDPGERYQTMATVKHDLERIKAGKSVQVGGQKTTIAPGQITAKLREQDFAEHDHELDPEQGNAHGLALKQSIALLALAALLFLALGSAVMFLNRSANPTKRLHTQVQKEEQRLSSTKESALDIKMEATNNLPEFHFINYYKDANRLRDVIENYMKNAGASSAHFKQNGTPAGFLFPSDFYFAEIKVGDKEPVIARGFIPALKGEPVTLYFVKEMGIYPAIMNKIGPDDLTGLEFVTPVPKDFLPRLKSWHRLRHLSLFNSLIKATHTHLEYDESTLSPADLKTIDQLEQIDSLGLCSSNISGDDVVKMKLINSVHRLWIKGIRDPAPLLLALQNKENIKELWLANQDLTDEQLLPLVKMKHLASLRLRVSNLTINSAKYFKQMRSLRHLALDNDWSEAEKKQFKIEVPCCEFEPSSDFRFWQMFPDQEVDLRPTG